MLSIDTYMQQGLKETLPVPNHGQMFPMSVPMQTDMNTQQGTMNQQCMGQMPSLVRMGKVVNDNNNTTTCNNKVNINTI